MKTAVRNYALVTGAYWGFTLTDGALRMLVLLHFDRLGYSAVAIATSARQGRRHFRGQFDQPVGVAPFIVVPGKDFDLRAIDDHRRRTVDDRGTRVVDEIHRDKRALLEPQDLLERTRGGLSQESVDLFDGGWARDFKYAVRQRGIQ